MSENKKTPRRPTMADIARLAHLHKSTVSLALRNQPSIPAATRERVRTIAAQLGYRPDPVLAAFNASRLSLSRHSQPHRPTIAFVSDQPDPRAFDTSERHRELFAGAREQAAKLGSLLELFLTGPAQLPPSRLDLILKARAISGVIVGAFSPQTHALPLDWAHLCGIAIESEHVAPPLDNLAANHREAARLAIQHLRAQGHQRVGFVLDPALGESIVEQLRAGYLVESPSGRHRPAPPFLRTPRDHTPSGLRLWIKKFHLDGAVFCGLPPVPGLPIRTSASIDIHTARPGTPGVPAPHRELGRHAVEMLALRQHANLTGLPSRISTTLLPATWRDPTAG